MHATRPVVHVNGDHAQYLDHAFRMDWIGGEPFPADDESDEAGWFELDALPDMSDDMRRRIALAGDDGQSAATVFESSQ